MKKYIALAVLLPLAAVLYAEDNIDRFILPETPPTIERVKKPPLDSPQIRKQDFIDESDVTLPPALLGADFPSFSAENHPVTIGIFQGSFGTLGGSFDFSSPKGMDIGFDTHRTSGESPRLAKDSSDFRYQMERPAGESLMVSGSAGARDEIFWNQKKSLYRAGGEADWYPRANLHLKAGASYARAEVKDMGDDENIAGRLAASWQPWDGHTLSLDYRPEKDSAFTACGPFSTLGLSYDIALVPRLVVGGGYRLQKDTLFPQAEIIWEALPGLNVQARYQPGIEKPVWSDLYSSDRYVQVNPDLAFPESRFALSEKAVCRLNKEATATLEFRQADYANYIYWQSVAGTDYVMPLNRNRLYVSGAAFGLKYEGERFSPRITLAYNAFEGLPFVPQYEGAAAADYALGLWTMSAGYRWTAARYFSTASLERLPASGSLLLGVRRALPGGIDLFVEGENLLGEGSETQPGFVRAARTMTAGITMHFDGKK